MSELEVVEREIDGPEPVERTLLLDQQPIAVAFVDPKKREATLVWVAAKGTELLKVLEKFLCAFPDSIGRHVLTVGFWVGDSYHEKTFVRRPAAGEIVSVIRHSPHAASSLKLLNISSGSVTLELVFDDEAEHPSRIALLMSAVDIGMLANFFTRFHQNDKVRADDMTTAFRPPLPNRLADMIY